MVSIKERIKRSFDELMEGAELLRVRSIFSLRNDEAITVSLSVLSLISLLNLTIFFSLVSYGALKRDVLR